MSDVQGSVDDLEAELVNNKKVQQSISSGAFEVTALDYSPEKEKEKAENDEFKARLLSYRQKALANGIPEDVLNAVEKKATPETVKSASDYISLVDKVSTQESEDEDLSDEDLVFKQYKDKQEMARLSKMTNLGVELNKRILNTYNTTAVRAEDLMKAVDKDKSLEKHLRLDIYKSPIYSLLINIEADWVAKIVKDVLKSWENNPTIRGVVEDYIASLHGGTLDGLDLDKEMLALRQALPDSIRNEDSPDLYKSYKAVCIICQINADDIFLDDKFEDKLLSNAEAGVEFSSNATVSMDAGEPFTASMHSAAMDTADTVLEGKDDSIKAKAVALYISAMQMKAGKNGRFEEFIKDSVSDEVYEEYLAVKEQQDAISKAKKEKREVARKERLQRKEERDALSKDKKEQKEEARKERIQRREERADEKHQRELARLERETEKAIRQTELAEAQQRCDQATMQQQQQQQPYVNRTAQYGTQTPYAGNSNYERYGNPYGRNSNPYGNPYDDPYGRQYNKYGGHNIGASNIPPYLIGYVVNIILGLLAYIIFEKFIMVVAIGGLVVSCVGFFKLQTHEKGAIPVICGGYLVALLAIILNFMR